MRPPERKNTSPCRVKTLFWRGNAFPRRDKVSLWQGKMVPYKWGNAFPQWTGECGVKSVGEYIPLPRIKSRFGRGTRSPAVYKALFLQALIPAEGCFRNEIWIN